MRPPIESERGGSPSVEAAILAGTLALVVAFGIAGMRVAIAESATSQAATSAARIASIQRYPDAATDIAKQEATAAMERGGISCAAIAVDVAIEEAGELTVVRATVSCDANWSDLTIPGAPGTHRSTATAVSPIDTLRER